jgi:ligand-binding SRPBCC domain-containing protein
MHTIRVQIVISAPIERCFDLARSVDAHVYSAALTGERAVGGRVEGLLGLGEHVTWEARHFGIKQRLASEITEYDRPNRFQDRMVRGAFASLEHDHFFTSRGDNETLMVDVMRFAVPLGPVGWVVGRLVLTPYLRRFLVRRNQALKHLAESNAWREVLPDC